MAKGGSGDVLGGMVLSFLGQGMEPLKAAALAVYLHGLAGDLCRDRLGITACCRGIWQRRSLPPFCAAERS